VTSEDPPTLIFFIRTRKDFLFAEFNQEQTALKSATILWDQSNFLLASRFPNFGEFSGANQKSLRITGC
jgi:hypothetical protein